VGRPASCRSTGRLAAMTRFGPAGMIEAIVSAVAYQPVETLRPTNESPTDEIALALATADDLDAGMTAVATALRRLGGSQRVEWWASDRAGGDLRLRAA